MRLVGSSHPGDVERDTAVRLLLERAVLTRAVCRELLEADRYDDRRPCIALYYLLGWIQGILPGALRVVPAAGNLCQPELQPSDGIDLMAAPDGCEDLLQEICDGAHVADALVMLLTADHPTHHRGGDEAVIRDRLAAYWAKHKAAVRAPSPIECWSGFPKSRAES